MSSTVPQKKRIQYFDVLKGIAIFMVVMGHALNFVIGNMDSNFTMGLIENTHMPIFFLISGYFSYKIIDGKCYVSPNLKKRFQQLIVPFLCITPLWFLYNSSAHILGEPENGISGLYFDFNKNGYWFTLCLFEIMIVYWVLSKMLSHIKSSILQISVIFATYLILFAIPFVVLKLGYDQYNNLLGMWMVYSYFMAFMVGVIFRKHKTIVEKLMQKESVMLISILTLALTLYISIYGLPNLSNSINTLCNVAVITPLKYISLFIVAVALTKPWCEKEFSEPGEPSVIASWFRYLGINSLEIYLVHYFFLFHAPFLQPHLNATGQQFVPLVVTSGIIAICVISVTLLAVRIIKCSSILAFLFLGNPLKQQS